MFNIENNVLKAGLSHLLRIAEALEGIHKELKELNEREYQKTL